MVFLKKKTTLNFVNCSRPCAFSSDSLWFYPIGLTARRKKKLRAVLNEVVRSWENSTISRWLVSTYSSKAWYSCRGGVRFCSLNGVFIADSVRYRCAIFAIIRKVGHFIACNRGIFGTAMYHLYLHFFTHGETAPTPSFFSFTWAILQRYNKLIAQHIFWCFNFTYFFEKKKELYK